MSRALIRRAWNSPTLTTWASIGTQTLSLVLVLPLILTRLSAAEIAVWYLFATIIGFQIVFQFGFIPTFTRLIAYAMGGSRLEDMVDLRERKAREVDSNDSPGPVPEVMSTLRGTMWLVFLGVGLVAFIVLGSLGTAVIWRPIGLTPDPMMNWWAWSVVCASTGYRLYGSAYVAYLNGTNHVALVARWQALFNICSILSMFAVMLVHPSLLGVVIAQQVWVIFTVARNQWLANRVEEQILPPERRAGIRFSREAFGIAWPSVWRSGTGQVLGYTLTHSLGIFYAQVGEAKSVASYLLGVRLIQIVANLAQAPFYSKIPLLSRMRASGDWTGQEDLASRSMRLAHLAFVASAGVLALFGAFLLDIIGANIPFPSQTLWLLLAAAFFLQRFGGMHLQLYSTTNQIVWHKANGIQAALILLSIYPLFQGFKANGLALALVFGNLGFAVYSASRTYASMLERPWSFEKKTLVPAAALFVGVVVAGFFILPLFNRVLALR